MRRIFVLSICLLSVAIGMMAQTEAPFWRTTISTTGLYGACDEEGNSQIPNVFQRMGFWGSNAVSFVQYDDRYYIIDRRGDMVGGESWELEPVIFSRYALVGNADARYLIDLHGNKLTIESKELMMPKGWNWLEDNLLIMLKEGDGIFNLEGIDGQPLLTGCSTIEPMKQLALVRYVKNGTMGAINMAGADIIPCRYTRLEEVRLGDWGKDLELMKKSKVAKIYNLKELTNMILVFAYNDKGEVDVYDMAGKMIGTTFEDEGTERVLRKLVDKPLMTYLQVKDVNMGAARSLVELPRRNFEQRQHDFINGLPGETVGGMSLLDLSKEKVMQINSLRRNDLMASNRELQAKREQIDSDFMLNKKPRAAAKRDDELKELGVELPEEGVLPDKFELYYASPDRDRAILITGGKTDSYIFSSSSKGGDVVTVTIGMPKEDEEGWVFADDGSKRSVVVAKDWSMVGLRQGRSTLYFSLPVTEHDYEIIKATETKR